MQHYKNILLYVSYFVIILNPLFIRASDTDKFFIDDHYSFRVGGNFQSITAEINRYPLSLEINHPHFLDQLIINGLKEKTKVNIGDIIYSEPINYISLPFNYLTGTISYPLSYRVHGNYNPPLTSILLKFSRCRKRYIFVGYSFKMFDGQEDPLRFLSSKQESLINVGLGRERKKGPWSLDFRMYWALPSNITKLDIIRIIPLCSLQLKYDFNH